MKRWVSIILAASLGLAALTLSGCNTVRGIGQDIRGAGDAISDASKK